MTIISKDSERLIDAISDAENMFWARIAAAYPEAKTGDLSPMTAIDLTDVMRRAVTEWLEYNADVEVENPQTAEILLHRIEYFYRNPHGSLLLTDSDKEHIADCITQGIREGELCTMLEVSPVKEIEVYGYWNINNNPNA